MLPARLRTFFTTSGRGFRAPARLFWVALAVRLLYMTLAHTWRIRPFDDHFEFGWEDGRIARALVTGFGYADPFNGHSGPTAWTPPLFPLLLAGVFKLCGLYSPLSAWVILAVDSVFSAATALAVYELARRSFARLPNALSLALWSGWLWALYPAAMQYAVRWIWETTLSTFLFAAILVLALRIRNIGESPEYQSALHSAQPYGAEWVRPALSKTGNTPQNWAMFAVLWGLVALTNSSLLLFLPACGLWLLLGSRQASSSSAQKPRHPERSAAQPKDLEAPHPATNLHPFSPQISFARTLLNAALSGVIFLAILTPWIVRNQRAFDAFVPLRSNFGAEFYESVLPVNGAFPWGTTVSLNPHSAQFERYRSLGELRYSKLQGQRAAALVRAHPGRFLKYMLERADFFWFGVAHPTDKSLLGEVLRQLNFSFLSVTGLLGLALALRRRIPGAALYAWAFALVPLIYYAITVQARFRHPLEPVITILTVYLFQSADRTRAFSRQSHALYP